LAPRQCESEADCQANAGCFADEISGINEFGELNTICHCFLEYVVDNTTASFPRTGECIHYRDVPCNVNTEINCFEDQEEWGICPYCRAFKHTDDFGGILELGNYVSGSGDFIAGDPMVFEGGDPVNCQGNVARSSVGYWYCWYDAFDDIVDLNHIELFWSEIPLCHYSVYIYTPLACDWAKP